jgi:hypothetical protein
MDRFPPTTNKDWRCFRVYSLTGFVGLIAGLSGFEKTLVFNRLKETNEVQGEYR